jgi:hypothetical protein
MRGLNSQIDMPRNCDTSAQRWSTAVGQPAPCLRIGAEVTLRIA